jgi:hypothetical protein
MSKIKLSVPTRPYGWPDPRMPSFVGVTYTYEVRPTAWHAWVPGCKWEVVKVYEVTAKTEVLATVDSREVAEGFIKLLKE